MPAGASGRDSCGWCGRGDSNCPPCALPTCSVPTTNGRSTLQFYCRLFRRALRCSPETFDCLCETVAGKISERAYHFWLLEAQVLLP